MFRPSTRSPHPLTSFLQGFIEFLTEHIPETVGEEENNLETESTDSIESGSSGSDKNEL